MGEWKDKVMWRDPTPSDKTEREQQLELESEQTKIEKSWQQVRIQAAIAAMQGMLMGDTAPHDVALSISAVELADALVAELKKGGGHADIQQ